MFVRLDTFTKFKLGRYTLMKSSEYSNVIFSKSMYYGILLLL